MQLIVIILAQGDILFLIVRTCAPVSGKVNKIIGQMHKIYFEKRCIVICSPDDPALSDPNAIHFKIGRSMDIHNLIEMVERKLHRR
mgnify:CR=1 FL=1